MDHLAASANGNGKHDPAPDSERTGGQGELLPAGRSGHERGDIALVGRAIRERWKIPEAALELVGSQAFKIMLTSNKDREKLRAAALLVKMQAENLAADVAADKMERLDVGCPTERIELRPITLRTVERIG